MNNILAFTLVVIFKKGKFVEFTPKMIFQSRIGLV